MPIQLSGSLVITGSITTTGGITISGSILSASYSATSSFSNDFTVLGNLTVFGTQSVQYITSSQLNISDNVITVNVASPGVRFGGLSVFDSGSLSSEATASLFWDSQNNHWVYQRESGSTYDGGMIMSGPRNSAGLGNESGTTSCMLLVGQGGDHLTSSMIYHSSTVTCVPNILTINGTVKSCQDLQLLGVNPRIDYPSGSSLRFYQPGVGTILEIENNLNVAFCCGITTNNTVSVTAPSDATTLKLNGRSSDNIGQILMYANDGSTLYNYIGSTCSSLAISTELNTPIYFQTNMAVNGGTKMTILGNGNIGIGTIAPICNNIKGALTIVKCHNNDTPVSPTACNYADNQSGLYIFGRNSGVTIAANNNEEGEIIFASPCTRAYARIATGTQSTTTGGDMYFKVGSDTERMRITNTGNVGVGNACPTYKLQITTDCTSQQYARNLILETTATGDYHPGLYFKGCRAGCEHEASIVLDGGATNGALLDFRIKNINSCWIRPIAINASGCISLGKGQNDQATAIFQPDNVGATITVCRQGYNASFLPFSIIDAGSCQNITGNPGGYSYGTTCIVAGVVSAAADTLFGIVRLSNDNVASGFKGFKGRGDTYTPSSVCTEDQILTIEGWAFHGSGPNQAKFGAGMRFVKDDAYGTASTYAPQRTEFYNANTGTSVLTTFIIYPNGNYDPTGTDVSDRRFKCNINYVTDQQSGMIMRLKPATFNKARGLCACNPVTFTGFIAQDVLESCIPNLVSGTEVEGYGLDYNGILTMIVKGFQEQQCTINTLKTCLGIA